MANINLLGQENFQSQPKITGEKIGTTLSVVGALILVLIVAAYWWFVWQEKSVISDTADLKTKFAVLDKEVSSSPIRKEAILRQGQILELKQLLGGYTYWSRLLPELSKVTLKTSGYVSLTASSDKNLHLNVVMPDFAEFDKFLKVFDNSVYNTKFKNLKVVSAGRFQNEQGSGVRAEVEVQIKPELLNSKLEGGQQL
jgi:hypothetical protein